MSTEKDEEDQLNKLPSFDARDFEPPAWATSSRFHWGGETKNGESSKSTVPPKRPGDIDSTQEEEDEEDEEDEDEFVDASEGESMPDLPDPDILTFTTAELKATGLKTKGNTLFTARPPDHAGAVQAYKSALDHLPPTPDLNEGASSSKTAAPPPPPVSGIQEVTDEEAVAIEEENKAQEVVSPEHKDRREIEESIRECTKACWGNLAATHLALGEDEEAIKACTKALEIDPHYVKALQRRASANERKGSWSSLTSAQEDYTLLLTLVPRSSPLVPPTRRALQTLPERIRVQQEKEKDEMLDKLKELGNGLLGKFGLSTDMFKFDQQEGGGYNMRFER